MSRLLSALDILRLIPVEPAILWLREARAIGPSSSIGFIAKLRRIQPRVTCFLAAACWLSLVSLASADLPVEFREQTITKDLKLGYQLVDTDINGDGRVDLIAVDELGTELAWLENPGWQRHVITTDVPRTINVACADVDGDGVPEIAILYRFDWRNKTGGIVSLLQHDGDVRGTWKEFEIDRVPTAHRVRWLEPERGDGPVMVMAPMIGLTAEPPEFQATVPIYLYRPGSWKRELLSDELGGVVHSIYPIDWDGDGRQELLTASFLGLHLFRPAGEGQWRSQEIGAGMVGACPKCGSSEVVQGRLEEERFLATVEPWHGSQIVTYREVRGVWERTVIDDSFQNGHALAVGDLDGDGQDEVVAGYRGKGYRLYLYQAERNDGVSWRREVLDAGGIAAADCKIRDFNGDGRADIACIGASTGNVKLYENLGTRGPRSRDATEGAQPAHRSQ